MKILLLDTGRGNHAGVIEGWRAKLELRPDDTVSLFSWQPPREPLPVAEHLVFGPRLDPRRREPRRSRTAFDLLHDVDITPAQMRRAPAPRPGPADDPAARGEAPMSEVDLAEQLTEQTADRSTLDVAERGSAGDDASEGVPPVLLDLEEAFAGDEEFDESVELALRANRTASLPLHHPDRLKQAARWRANRARLAARGVYRRGKGRLKRSRSVPARVAKKALGISADGVATRFAVAALRSEQAAQVFTSADVVLPMDARSQRTAWFLARRYEGPDVVIGFPTGVRVIDERRRR